VRTVHFGNEGGRVTAACDDGKVYAVNVKGDVLWVQKAGKPITGLAIDRREKLFLAASHDKRASLIGFTIGAQELFKLGLPGGVSAVAMTEHTLGFLALGNGEAAGIDQYVNKLWGARPPAPMVAVAMSYDGKRAYGVGGGTLSGYDAAGKLLLQAKVAPDLRRLSTTNDGALVVGASPSGGFIEAVRADGQPRWRHAGQGAMVAADVDVKGGLVVGGDNGGRVHALDAAGKVRWQKDLGQPITDAVVAPDGSCVAASTVTGDIAVFDPQGKDLALIGDFRGRVHILCLSLRSNGWNVAAGCADGTVIGASTNLSEYGDSGWVTASESGGVATAPFRLRRKRA
jgi:hypothetical protein